MEARGLTTFFIVEFFLFDTRKGSNIDYAGDNEDNAQSNN